MSDFGEEKILPNSAPTQRVIIEDVPLHAPFVDSDGATERLRVEGEAQKVREAEQHARSMKDITRVYQCTNCRKRLSPSSVGGNVQYAKCPHCKQLTYPSGRDMYAGKPVQFTDRYAKVPNDPFKQGSDDNGGLRFRK